MEYIYSPTIPKDSGALADLHQEIAAAMPAGLRSVGDAQVMHFGEKATQAAMRALLVESSFPADRRPELRSRIDDLGWRRFLEDDDGCALDWVELTQPWRAGAEYAGQGIAPGEPPQHRSSLAERKARIEPLIEYSKLAARGEFPMLGTAYNFIWTGVAARAAVDFGGTVSLEGLRLLSGVTLAAVRNAVSLGELHPDEASAIPAEEACRWLARRRDYCPSRWKNPADDQWPLDPSKVAIENQEGKVWVPCGADGLAFTPQHVARSARRTCTLSVTVGAKGEERQYRDFYEALAALAGMKIPRWRRRNEVGNWGIVRARGAWVAFSKIEIDGQIAGKHAELS